MKLRNSFLSEIALSAAHLLLPRLCAACNQPLLLQEKALCFSCTLDIPQTNFHHHDENESVIRIAGRIPFKHATSFAYFQGDGLMQHLLHLLKYKGRQDVGRFLGRQAAYALREVSWIKHLDGIIPLPLHARKQKLRGYNQAEVIAAALAKELGLPLLPNALVRIRDTQSQTLMNREQRIANVRDAFQPGPGFQKLNEKKVLLMDDVLTTGATLEAAARPLQTVSGLELNLFTLGIAVQ
jgi:ComF family protein